MRFISKNSNLRIILRPGLPSSPLTGTMAVPSVFVKFEGGEAIVNNEDLVEMMHNHSGFGTDFIAVDEKGEDPFKYYREEMEPIHHIQEIKYGQAENHVSSKRAPKLSPEMEKMINDLAMAKVREILPSAMEAFNKAKQQATEKDFNEEKEVFPVVTDSDTEPVKKEIKKIVKSTKGRKAKVK